MNMVDLYTLKHPDLIARHLELMLAYNKTMNLTRIDDEDEAKLLHIEDSLAALDLLEKAPCGRYADLGSGGGYPGIPLAIESGRRTLLVDSVKKKANALQGMVEELGLQDQIAVFGGRIEDLAKESPREFAVITARALSSLPSLVELASPLLMNHGQLICFKGNMSGEELRAAIDISHQTAMYLLKQEKFYLSDNETSRQFVVFEKRGNPSVKLPRNNGMAQKRPLQPRVTKD